MDKLKMYYAREDFKRVEYARAHFERNWSEDNPGIARNLSLEEVKEKYEGAHYRDRRWYLYTEINDYRNLDPTPTPSGAGNIIVTCPSCDNAGMARKGGWPEATRYVHIIGKENNRSVDIFVCEVRRDPNAMTYYDS